MTIMAHLGRASAERAKERTSKVSGKSMDMLKKQEVLRHFSWEGTP